MTAPRPDTLLGDDQRTVQVSQLSYQQAGRAQFAGDYPQRAAGSYATATPTYPPITGGQNTAGQWYANPGAAYPAPSGSSPTPGYPGAAYPMPAQPVVPAPKRRGPWILMASVAAVLVVGLIATVIKLTVFSSNADTTNTAQAGQATANTDTPPAAPPVSASELEDLLLSKSEVAEIVGATSMIGAKNSGDQIYRTMGKNKYIDADCIILMPTEQANYGGSGYTGARSQFLDSPTMDRRIEQAVVSFPDAESAANYITTAKEKIGKCSNRSANFRKTTETEDDWWTVGSPADINGVTTVPHSQEGHEGWTCQTGLTARNNVVVDLYVCGRDIPDNVAVTFANTIADNAAKPN